MKKKETNVCGIIGLCTGWLMPISGVVLGIIALSRKERNSIIGTLSIIEGTIAWAIAIALYL